MGIGPEEESLYESKEEVYTDTQVECALEGSHVELKCGAPRYNRRMELLCYNKEKKIFSLCARVMLDFQTPPPFYYFRF